MIVEARDITLEAAKRALEVIQETAAGEGAQGMAAITIDGIDE